jgi:hypothetical protein
MQLPLLLHVPSYTRSASVKALLRRD